jgi:hypothetical protein
VTSITEVYKTVKINRGDVHSYVGMTLDFSLPGKCEVSMAGYVEDVLRLYGVDRAAATPATATLFDVREGSPLLDKEGREFLHSAVAKLLFLAKRTRPELLPATSFLATRVQSPNEDDMNKLARVLKYLYGTKGQTLVLSFEKGMNLRAFIDASYGVHVDGKSHTGGVMTLGGGGLGPRSIKQKIVAKSSTEAELIGVSDYLGDVIETRNYLIAQGYAMGPALVLQDNQSTLHLIKNGRTSSDRTRHIDVRYFFVKDRVEQGEIVCRHQPTGSMLADVLTKPLQGKLFRVLQQELLQGKEGQERAVKDNAPAARRGVSE